MEANGYVPAKSFGVSVLGTRIRNRGILSYNFSLSHSEDELEDEEEIDDATGAGLDLNWSRPNRFLIGFSGYFYADPKEDERYAKALLPYGEVTLIARLLSWRTEVLALERDGEEDVLAWYSRLKLQWHSDAYANLRFDRGDDERYAEGRRRETQSLTLGWRPTRKLRIKAEYAHDDFADGADQNRWSIWAGWLLR
jgi:hypothetical protein